jgi:predicted nucleic acid-binding protein
LEEAASRILREYLRKYADDAKASSTLGQVEARSAIQRRLRNLEFDLDAASTALSDLEQVSGLWVRIAMDDRVINFASGVISRHALRSLDALQLASARALREELDESDDLLFIACDKRLLTAATAEHLTVWNPETSSVPPIPPVN